MHRSLMLLACLFLLCGPLSAQQIGVYYQIFSLFGPSTSVPSYGPLFTEIGGFSTTESAVGNCVGGSGSLKITDIRARLFSAPGAAASGKQWKFTIRDGGMDTGATVTFFETATVANFTGLPLTIHPGDYIDLRADPTNTPTINGSKFLTLSFRWTNSASAYPVFTSVQGLYTVGQSGSGAPYISPTALFAQDGGGTPYTGANTDVQEQSPLPVGGTVQRLYVNLSLDPTSGGVNPTDSVTVTIQRNPYSGGVNTGQSDTSVSAVLSATTGSDLVHSVHFNAGDMICVHIVTTANVAPVRVSIGYEIVPDEFGDCFLLGEFNGNSTVYQWKQNSSNSTTESQVTQNFFPGTIKKLWARASGTPVSTNVWQNWPAGSSLTFSLRDNSANAGSPSTLSLSIPAGSQYAQDLTDSAVISDTDNVNMLYTVVGSPAASTGGHWGMCIQVPQLPIFRRPLNPRAGSRGTVAIGEHDQFRPDLAMLDYINSHDQNASKEAICAH